MDPPVWFVLADVDRARILELAAPGGPLRRVEDLTDPLTVAVPGGPETDREIQRFAHRIAERLEQAYAQACFEFVRIAAAPRFIERLRAEIDRHIDLHRAELDWLARDLMAVDDVEAVRQMESARAAGTGGS
jgi:predicted metal-dependent phosphoesterase TrpH